MATANQEWFRLIRQLLLSGNHESPRGQDTVERLGATATVEMSKPLVTLPDRELGHRFAAAEAAWILSGDDRVKTIKPYAPAIAQFSDDGERFFGAYGPKIVEQIDYVAHTLLNDPSSRQAVITIWRENPPASKDIPCTISYQALIRNGRLHACYVMRSSDAWLGWPYDIFNFSMLSAAVALLVNRWAGKQVVRSLGNLRWFAGSSHLYLRNLEGAERVLENPPTERDEAYEPFRLADWSDELELIEHLWKLANLELQLPGKGWLVPFYHARYHQT